MSKLFIIGNGFDLSHGLKTKYDDFHRYLKHRFPNSTEDRIVIPERGFSRRGEELYDENEVVSLLRYLISETVNWGDHWSDVEASLGYLNLSECFQDITDPTEKEGALNIVRQQYYNRGRASELAGAILSITEYFSHWIETVEISGRPKPDFEALIDPKSDLFLSFNYTETLETLYHAEHVCHIHGKRGTPMLFGHGVDRDIQHDPNTPFGAELELQNIHDSLRKNTKAAIQAHWDFFKLMTDEITDIYSYGFSLSAVDKPYIKIICGRLQTEKMVWYLNDFDTPQFRRQLQKSAVECGFRGVFDVFHIL